MHISPAKEMQKCKELWTRIWSKLKACISHYIEGCTNPEFVVCTLATLKHPPCTSRRGSSILLVLFVLKIDVHIKASVGERNHYILGQYWHKRLGGILGK